MIRTMFLCFAIVLAGGCKNDTQKKGADDSASQSFSREIGNAGQTDKKESFIHRFRLVQDGEPVVSDFTFDNPFGSQPLQFFMQIRPDEGEKGHISGLRLTINNYAEIALPGNYGPGDEISCDGREVVIRSKDGKTRKESSVSIPSLVKGKNLVRVQSDFSGEKQLINLEILAGKTN